MPSSFTSFLTACSMPKKVVKKKNFIQLNFVAMYAIVVREVAYHKGDHRGPLASLRVVGQDQRTGKWNNYQTAVCYGPVATWCHHYLMPKMRVMLIGNLGRFRWHGADGRWVVGSQLKVRQVFLSPWWGGTTSKEILLMTDAGDPVEMSPVWGHEVWSDSTEEVGGGNLEMVDESPGDPGDSHGNGTSGVLGVQEGDLDGKGGDSA